MKLQNYNEYAKLNERRPTTFKDSKSFIKYLDDEIKKLGIITMSIHNNIHIFISQIDNSDVQAKLNTNLLEARKEMMDYKKLLKEVKNIVSTVEI